MRWPIIIIGTLASLGLIGVSVGVNFQFGASIGRTGFDAVLYGGAAGLADILKAACPLLIAWAMRERNIAAAGAGICILVACIILSFTSAIGFSALNRAGTTGARTLNNMQFEQLRAEQARLREKLSWHPRHRPAAVVATDIIAAEQNWRWKTTRGCKNATVPPSIAFCDHYRGLVTERAIAQDEAKLDRRLKEVRTKLEGIDPSAISSGTHPQIATLSHLSGQPPETVRTGLIILLALVVEFGSSCGLFLACSAARRQRSLSPSGNTNGRAHNRRKPAKPRLIYSATEKVRSDDTEQSAARSFLNLRTEPSKGSAIGATELFNRYMIEGKIRWWPKVSQRRFGALMAALGHREKKRCGKTGRVQYCGLSWKADRQEKLAA